MYQIAKINNNKLQPITSLTQMDSPLSPVSPHMKRHNLSKKLSKILKQQQHAIQLKDISPGKITVTGSDRCKLRVVNFFGDISTQIFCLHTSSDDQYVAAGCENGDVRVYHIYEGKIVLLANSSRMQGYPNTGIRWRPKSNTEIAACNSDGTIKWYSRQKQMAVATHQSQIGYLCTDYSSDGNYSIFGNEKYQIELFDTETKKLSQKYDAGSVQSWAPNHINRIFCIRAIPTQPNLFFSGGWDSTVRLWDIRLPKEYVRKFYGPSISSQSLDLKGNTLLVGNYANKDIVQLWDFGAGKLIENVSIGETGDIGGAYCLCAGYAHKSKHNLYAAGLTCINKVKIFQDNRVIGNIQLQAAPLALNFYQFNNKDFMVASGVEGTIYAIKVKIIQPQKQKA